MVRVTCKGLEPVHLFKVQSLVKVVGKGDLQMRYHRISDNISMGPSASLSALQRRTCLSTICCYRIKSLAKDLSPFPISHVY